jgi:hypothetical protein
VRIKGLLPDRKPLIAALERETGKTAVYCGAPTFRYQVGDCTVLRDGSLEVADADTDLINRLSREGLIEQPQNIQDGILFPLEKFTGRALANLVFMFAAKGAMINKAIGTPEAFHMSAALVRKLQVEKPSTRSEFMAVIHDCGGRDAMKGLWISAEEIIFTGFPDNEACRALAELMAHTSINSQWIKAKEPTVTNEKYSFRVWLTSIGMNGKQYGAARAELLKNFTGDGAFRTPDQRTAFYERRKKRPEPEFVLL